jgi:hypothetical protein
MFIYNITYLVSHEIHDEWLIWMKTQHCLEILSTGHFSEYKILRILGTDESEGLTYAFQFYFADLIQHDEYISKHGPALRLRAKERWGDKAMAFRTLMEIVQ